MAEQPPLSRIHVVGYSANDRDFPILNLVLDPRVAGYQVPKDLSACPDKRYPNHVFTGAQPIAGDQRVRHVWEILPSPWVPFTRYDDDLGPIQGRRRSVKNDGQVASLSAEKRTTYEAREGSAIVYTELEETWSIKVDEDGNSLFPIRDRDFYDPSRGPVQERRQLFVPTGEEVGSLENVNGVITQTSYEPYNEFLSVKIVQTYKVDGPQLIGKATDNDGQLVTVTTQRKGADGYVPPNPTATRTVEVSREDAESLVERIVDTPEVFKANTFSVERPDPIPQKFRVAVPIQSSQEIVEGEADPNVSLSTGELSKTEEQRNKFIKRVSTTSRDQAVLPKTLTGKATDNDRQEVTITETLQLGDTNEVPTATKTVESEDLGDGNYVVRKTEIPAIFGAETFRKTREDLTPQKFKAAQEDSTTEQNVAGIASSAITLATGEFAKSEQQINKFVKRVSTTSRSTQTPSPLTELVLTPEGQIGTRTLTLASGDQSFDPSATLIDASVEALGDGRTVKTEISVDVLFDAKQESLEKPEIIPPEFRASLQNRTVSQIVAGQSATVPSLSKDEISRTVQRLTENKIREITVTRPSSYEPLVGQIIDNDLIAITRTKTVVRGQQLIQQNARTSGTVEALGDGYTLKTEDVKSEIFKENQSSLSQPVQIPSKFLTSIEEQSKIEESQEAIPEELGEDGFGNIQTSAQRINQFTVRKTERKQSGQTSLIEKQTNNFKQEVTITSSIVDESDIQPSAITEILRTQAIGGGKYLKEEGTVSEVFPQRSFSKERPDPAPQKFRIEIPALTDEITEITSGVTQYDVNLEKEDISKNVQQIDKYTKRTRTTSRSETPEAKLEAKIFTTELGGGVATVIEKYGSQIDVDPDFGTISSDAEALGGGKFLSRKVILKNPPTLTGQNYDDIWDVSIPFTREFVKPEINQPTESSVEPRDPFHSLSNKIDIEKAKQNLLNVFYSVYDMQSISLPDRLKSGTWHIIYTEESSASSASGNSASASSTVGISTSVDLELDIQDGYRGLAPAKRCFFFLEKDDCTEEAIKQKVGVQNIFPIYRPKSHQIFVKFESKKELVTLQLSLPNNKSKIQSTSNSTGTKIFTIPPVIASDIPLAQESTGNLTITKSITITAPVGEGYKEDITVTVEPATIPEVILKTEIETVVAQDYLYAVNASPYRFGLVKVEAVVVTITEAMASTE